MGPKDIEDLLVMKIAAIADSHSAPLFVKVATIEDRRTSPGLAPAAFVALTEDKDSGVLPRLVAVETYAVEVFGKVGETDAERQIHALLAMP